MRHLFLAGLIGVLAAVSAAFPVHAQVSEDQLVTSETFLSAHPDLRFRHLGLKAHGEGRHEEAFVFFRRAARYADKVSQAMVAEMLWNGEGVEQDPVMAYAWMDLAAERAYRGFLTLRERYWKQLDPQQQAEAIRRGEAVYAEYGDAAARPRIDAALRRARSRMTGSRTGFTGTLQVFIAGPGGQMLSIDGSRFYDPKFWDPELYQAWHDAVWMEPRTGKVDIGDIEAVKQGESSDDD
ncbi:hypothetical protein ACW7G2_11470 [Luteimonas sp. A277]